MVASKLEPGRNSLTTVSNTSMLLLAVAKSLELAPMLRS